MSTVVLIGDEQVSIAKNIDILGLFTADVYIQADAMNFHVDGFI